MKAQSLKRRVQRVTTNYTSLQGLKMLPLGLWLCLEAIASFGWWPRYAHGRPLSSLLTLCAAGALWLLVGLYYTRSFGRVKPKPQRLRQLLQTGIIVIVISLPWLFIAGFLDGALQSRVSILGLAVAILLALGWIVGNLQEHYAVTAAIIAIISLLPLVGIIPGGQRSTLTIIIGVSLITCGVLDHIQLVRGLGILPQEEC